jgi:transketolase
VVDHHTYVFLGDGCLMEGISHEACALAGAWKLNKLVALYDDNGISIDGQVRPGTSTTPALRFAAYGWNVIGPVDGHDAAAWRAASIRPRPARRKPTLIICKTTIGKGSPNRAGTAKAHGEPLGADEIKLTRAALGWPHEPFVIPDEAYAAWDAKAAGARPPRPPGPSASAPTRRRYPELAAELQRRMKGELPAGFAQTAVDAVLAAAHQGRDRGQPQGQPAGAGGLHQGPARAAGRQRRPDRLQPHQHQASTPALRFDDDGAPNGGRHINYGVREFGMAAIMNGVALHGGFIPYGGTFLTFSDYSRNAIRMAALMKRA